ELNDADSGATNWNVFSGIRLATARTFLNSSSNGACPLYAKKAVSDSDISKPVFPCDTDTGLPNTVPGTALINVPGYSFRTASETPSVNTDHTPPTLPPKMVMLSGISLLLSSFPLGFSSPQPEINIEKKIINIIS